MPVAGIPAGQLRHRGTLRRYLKTKDVMRATKRTPMDLSDVSFSLEPLSAREVEYASELAAESTHKAVIRYYQGLTSEDELLWVDPADATVHTFHIDEVKDIDMRHIRMELSVHEN